MIFPTLVPAVDSSFLIAVNGFAFHISCVVRLNERIAGKGSAGNINVTDFHDSL